MSNAIVKRVNGLWHVLSGTQPRILTQFKSLSRKNAIEWAAHFNAACSTPIPDQLNASVGLAVWSARPSKKAQQ